MMNGQIVYEELNNIISDKLSAGGELSVFYTTDKYDKHIFYVVGTYDSIHDNPFRVFADFVDEFNVHDTRFDSTASGIHISFRFKENELKNCPPEPIKSYDTIKHRGTKSQQVNECSICRCNVSGLYLPPVKLVYPTPEYEDKYVEKHHMCVSCSPGHYDDVVRAIECFAVKNNEIIKVRFKNKTDNIEWKQKSNFGPYTQDTVDIIERHLL